MNKNLLLKSNINYFVPDETPILNFGIILYTVYKYKYRALSVCDTRGMYFEVKFKIVHFKICTYMI